MIVKCPNCKREIECENNSILVICKCGECAFDKEVED
jgi:hypothetical protein